MSPGTLHAVAVTPVTAAALLTAVYACAGRLQPHRRRPDPATIMMMADLDNSTWRARQLAQAYTHQAHQEIEAARVDLAFERVYGPLRTRHPLTPRQPRGIDTIACWWQPPPKGAATC